MQNTFASRYLGERTNKLLSTRRGTIILGAVAALMAALLLLAYLNRYRSSVSAASEPTPVLVADRLIAKGTSAAVMGTQHLFELATVPKKHVKVGAVVDPDALRGRVAVQDIFPGQQLTLADFSLTTTDAIPTRITGRERAISLAIEPAPGMTGHVTAGDHVDIYVGMQANVAGVASPIVKLLLQDVLILAAPGGAGGGLAAGAAGAYVFQVDTRDAGKLAFANDNGKLWLVARPTAGAKPSHAPLVTSNSLLYSRG